MGESFMISKDNGEIVRVLLDMREEQWGVWLEALWTVGEFVYDRYASVSCDSVRVSRRFSPASLVKQPAILVGDTALSQRIQSVHSKRQREATERLAADLSQDQKY